MEAPNIRQLLRNFFSLGFVQIVSSLLQLLIIPFVISRIGIENFGVIAVAQVLMVFLGTFCDYGFNQTATKDVALNKDDKNILSAIFSRVLYSKLFLCLVSFFILLFLSLIFPFTRQHFLLYCCGFAFVVGQAAMPLWFLQGQEKMHWAALATLFSKLIFVMLVLLFIKGPQHSPLFLFFMGTGSLLTGVIIMILIVRKWKLSLEKVSAAKIFFNLKDGWPVTGTNLSMNFIQYGNLFILRLFTNDLVAGYFGVAERIFFAVKQVLTIFSQTVYPRVCQLVAAGEEQLQVFFKKIFLPFFYSIVAGSIALYFLSPLLISFFTNELNPDSVFSLQMFCIVLPVICLNLPGTLSLLAFNRKKPYFMVYFSAMLICLLANIVLVPLFHSGGTIAAIFLTEIFITVTASVFQYRLLKKKIGT